MHPSRSVNWNPKASCRKRKKRRSEEKKISLIILPYACRRSCSSSCRLCRPIAGSDVLVREPESPAPGHGVPRQQRHCRWLSTLMMVRRLVACLPRGTPGKTYRRHRLCRLRLPWLGRHSSSRRMTKRLNSPTTKQLLN